jgi:hypothetical protein
MLFSPSIQILFAVINKSASQKERGARSFSPPPAQSGWGAMQVRCCKSRVHRFTPHMCDAAISRQGSRTVPLGRGLFVGYESTAAKLANKKLE